MVREALLPDFIGFKKASPASTSLDLEGEMKWDLCCREGFYLGMVFLEILGGFPALLTVDNTDYEKKHIYDGSCRRCTRFVQQD